MNRNLRVHLFLFLANLIYGVSFTIAKDVMPFYIKPFGTVLIRVTVSLVLFFICQKMFVREKVKRKDLFLLFLCGFFGVAVNQLMFFKGLSITTPISAALIMTTTPILVLLLSGLFHDEKITLLKVTGIITGLCGAVVIIVFGNPVSFSSDEFLGDIFVLLNASSYAVFIVIAKPLMKRYHPLTVILWVFFFGWLFVLPSGWNEFMAADWSSFPLTIWFELSFIVIATTFFAYLLNIYGLRDASPSVVGIYIYIQPAIAAFFAMLLGKDGFNVPKAVATLLIFAGVYMVSERRNGRTE